MGRTHKAVQISEETSLDGTYILRTTVDAQFSSGDIVCSYKELAKVERAFRTIDLSLVIVIVIEERLNE